MISKLKPFTSQFLRCFDDIWFKRMKANENNKNRMKTVNLYSLYIVYSSQSIDIIIYV